MKEQFPRAGRRIKIGPNAVDYNGLMYNFEISKRKLLLLTPRYGFFGRLKGYYAYVTFQEELYPYEGNSWA